MRQHRTGGSSRDSGIALGSEQEAFSWVRDAGEGSLHQTRLYGPKVGISGIFGSTKETKLIVSSTFAPQGDYPPQSSDIHEKTSHSHPPVHQTVVYIID
jgi:hypothetical protein